MAALRCGSDWPAGLHRVAHFLDVDQDARVHSRACSSAASLGRLEAVPKIVVLRRAEARPGTSPAICRLVSSRPPGETNAPDPPPIFTEASRRWSRNAASTSKPCFCFTVVGGELVVRPQAFIGRRGQRQQGNEKKCGISHDRLILRDSRAARQERIRIAVNYSAEKIHGTSRAVDRNQY